MTRVWLSTTLAFLISAGVAGYGLAADVPLASADVAGDKRQDAMISIQITVEGRSFAAKLHDNPSTRIFLQQMPVTLDMRDYAGKEKVVSLPYDFPASSPEQPATINAGELYLWSGNSLVLFYTSIQNSYGGYVRLGYIEDSSELRTALGSGTAAITFSRWNSSTVVD